MSGTMRFACLVKKGLAEVRERPIPDLGPHDVLIRNEACNICTSEYGQWLGLREHQGYPRCGGHENSAYVEAVGSEVTTCKPGDFVAVNSYIGCGVCEHCRKGEVSLCENSATSDYSIKTWDGYNGEFGFSTYAVWNEVAILQMNPKLDPGCAAFVEPLATVIKGQKKLRLQPFESVVVVGAGTMGLLNALEARARGAKVIVTELMEKKIKTAESLGFPVIDSSKEGAVEKVKELTGGKGADCAIVAVGATPANDQALQFVKEIDARVLMFAAAYPAPELNINSNQVHYRRIEIIGTYGADNAEFEEAAKQLSEGMIDVSALIEPKRYPLTQMQEAFAAAATPGMYRVCVECQK